MKITKILDKEITIEFKDSLLKFKLSTVIPNFYKMGCKRNKIEKFLNDYPFNEFVSALIPSDNENNTYIKLFDVNQFISYLYFIDINKNKKVLDSFGCIKGRDYISKMEVITSGLILPNDNFNKITTVKIDNDEFILHTLLDEDHHKELMCL